MHSSSILNIDLAQYATAKEAIANDEVLWGNNKQGPDEIIGKYQKLQDPEIKDSTKDDRNTRTPYRYDSSEVPTSQPKESVFPPYALRQVLD